MAPFNINELVAFRLVISQMVYLELSRQSILRSVLRLNQVIETDNGSFEKQSRLVI